MTRALILSDTHVPQRARALPDAVWRAIDEAELVIHAGDWNGLQLFDELADRAADLLAVYGNNDGPELRSLMPEVASGTVDGVRIAVIHDSGDAAGREHAATPASPTPTCSSSGTATSRGHHHARRACAC